MWDHVRSNDTDRTAMMGRATNRSATGRSDYLAQVAAFYDYYLKQEGTAPRGFYVQDNTASWRTQPAWPAPSSIRSAPLRRGSFKFNGQQVAVKVPYRNRWAATQSDGVAASFGTMRPTADRASNAVWTLLPPEATDVRISGAPRVRLHTRLAYANGIPMNQNPTAVGLYDVSPSGRATLITQNVAALTGPQTVIQLYATDWLVRAGHRLAVRVTDSNGYRWDYYAVPPNNLTVTVLDGELRLPMAAVNAGTPTSGTSNTSLEGHLRYYTYPVPQRSSR